MNIESSDAFPIFQEMINRNLNAHYLTMDYNIFEQTCIKRMNCSNNLEIIYGSRKINGDFLEKYLELILRLKAVITAEYYDCIDNLFYNIEYITFIFLGHGVTYIKSYLYEEYIHPKRYNKVLFLRQFVNTNTPSVSPCRAFSEGSPRPQYRRKW